MEINSENVEIIEEMDEEVYSCEAITDLGLTLKIEERGNIKTEVIEEINNSELLQIIGEKRKNQERSNLENENKKIKEEFVVFEESNYKQEPQTSKELILEDLNNQVIHIL